MAIKCRCKEPSVRAPSACHPRTALGVCHPATPAGVPLYEVLPRKQGEEHYVNAYFCKNFHLGLWAQFAYFAQLRNPNSNTGPVVGTLFAVVCDPFCHGFLPFLSMDKFVKPSAVTQPPSDEPNYDEIMTTLLSLMMVTVKYE